MLAKVVKQPSKKELKKIALYRNQSLAKKNVFQSFFFPKVSGVTYWEELECLGYNPESSKIEAVVNIKRSSGYSGDLCSLGSPEFIRFFIDYNDGNGFEDLGISSFRAFDISDAPPGPQHPISYMVSKKIDNSRKKKFCSNEVLVKLRAVLSWNSIPSTDPNDVPYYGNVLDAEAVLKPLQISFPIPPFNFQSINPLAADFLDQQLKVDKTALDIPSFIKTNLKNGVTPNRTVTQLLSLSESNTNGFLGNLQQLKLPDLGIDFNQILGNLGSEDFNNDYEEIVSVGMNTMRDTLGAIINIKRPVGYGGNLCNKGSMEYVSFFADFNNNGVFEQYLGTTFVKVNDIKNIPANGLDYAVFLKTDLSKYLKNCSKPQIIRIRAILSWANPPNPIDPEQSTKWGNRMDVLVQLRPKKSTQTSLIYSIGNVAIDNISPITHLAYPGDNGRQNNRPWGGLITIKGGIDNSGTPGTTKYRVEYSQNGIDYFPVTLKQTIRTIDYSTPLNPFTTHSLQDSNGWFPYLASHNTSNLIAIENDILASWPSHDFAGKYYIRVSFTKSDPILNPGSIEHSIPIRILLDNRRFRVDNTPNNTLDINFDIDMTIDGGVCKIYNQGERFTGKVKVKDQFYGGYDLVIQPSSQIINSVGLISYAPGAILNNASISETGPNNEAFSIDTGKLKKCGYTLRLRGYERAILNNSHLFPYKDKYVGFCVK